MTVLQQLRMEVREASGWATGRMCRSGRPLVPFIVAPVQALGSSVHLGTWERTGKDTDGLLKPCASSVLNRLTKTLQECAVFWAFSMLNMELLEMEQLSLSICQPLTASSPLTPSATAHLLTWADPPEFCLHVQTRMDSKHLSNAAPA